MMILVTGIFPLVVITLVSGIIVGPLFTDLDERSVISEMDQLLDLIEGTLNNEKIYVRSIAAYLVPVASGMQKTDFPVIMDVYSIDFLSVSTDGSFDGKSCWLRTETGIGEITDTKRFLDSVMEGPYAPGRLSPWGFISVGEKSDLYMLTASSGDADTEIVIIGHKINTPIYESKPFRLPQTMDKKRYRRFTLTITSFLIPSHRQLQVSAAPKAGF